MSEARIPEALWRDIVDFFSTIVAPCKDCLRGNLHNCWESRCAAFQFRSLARRILVASSNGQSYVRTPQSVEVEKEILELLSKYGKPIYPSMLILNSTHSRANKRNAINRLVKRGEIIEERINSYTRMLSLPPKPNKQ